MNTKAWTAKLSSLLAVFIVYLLLWFPLWQWLWLDVVALSLLVIAIYNRCYQHFWLQFKPVIIAFSALVVVDVATASLMTRSIVVSVHLLKALLLFVPALMVVQITCVSQRLLAMRNVALFACVLWFSVLLMVYVSAISMTLSRILEHYAAMYVGNLHNLTNAASLSLLLALVLLKFDSTMLGRVIAITLAVLCIALLGLAQSEGSVIGLCFSLAALFVLYGSRLWRVLAICGVVLLVVCLHLFYFQPQLLLQWLGISMHSFDERVSIYGQLLHYWSQSPWFGFGMGGYKFLPVAQVNGSSYLYPHHIYLEGLFSLGVVGLMALAVLLYFLGRNVCFQYVKQQPLALFSLLVLSYLAGKGMTDMKLLSHHTFTAIVVPLALMTRLPRKVA